MNPNAEITVLKVSFPDPVSTDHGGSVPDPYDVSQDTLQYYDNASHTAYSEASISEGAANVRGLEVRVTPVTGLSFRQRATPKEKRPGH